MSGDFLDSLIGRADAILRQLAPPAPPAPSSGPAESIPEAEMTATERRHAAALMRVNHAGEVCAQALYKGQALMARDKRVRADLLQAAREEYTHLGWCRQRLKELDAATSKLNPVWYAMSLSMGALVALAGDRVSLGFIAATEERVCQHLEQHLRLLPEQDRRSRAILTAMLQDEADHGKRALEAGGMDFPKPVKQAMTLVAQAMVQGSYHV